MKSERGNIRSSLFLHLGGLFLSSFLLGILLSAFFLVSVAREIASSYRNVALNWVKACQHEMTARGELGLLQQEMELNKAALERQGINMVEVISMSGLILLHSDDDLVGETADLTLNFRGALKGGSYQRLTGSGEDFRITLTEPLINYNQVWGALNISLKPEKKHVWPLRFGTVPKRLLFVLTAVDILLILLFLFKTLQSGKSALEELSKKEDSIRQDQLATVGAGLAHEVKNSLNGINMNAQLLKESLLASGASERQIQKLERIEREALSSGEMLAAFLSYAKSGDFSPKEVNLRSLINELGQFFTEAGEKENVRVSYSSENAPQSLLADEGSLRHAITNLMWNAVQAVSQSGGGNVALKGAAKGGMVEISVEDDGPGIPAEERDRIFQAFYTTKEKGAGLGLAVAKKAAVAHGGRLELKDAPKGCRFVLSFPLKESRND
ncbi:HAMP domain-containing histidine kinase [bacterium]|nr:HAMP domain-containing histidine kinase [bacterium]